MAQKIKTANSKETLNTYLHQGKNKNKACLLYVCNELGLDSSGIVAELITEIVKFTKQDNEEKTKEMETKVKKIVEAYKKGEIHKPGKTNLANSNSKSPHEEDGEIDDEDDDEPDSDNESDEGDESDAEDGELNIQGANKEPNLQSIENTGTGSGPNRKHHERISSMLDVLETSIDLMNADELDTEAPCVDSTLNHIVDMVSNINGHSQDLFSSQPADQVPETDTVSEETQFSEILGFSQYLPEGDTENPSVTLSFTEAVSATRKKWLEEKQQKAKTIQQFCQYKKDAETKIRLLEKKAAALPSNIYVSQMDKMTQIVSQKNKQINAFEQSLNQLQSIHDSFSDEICKAFKKNEEECEQFKSSIAILIESNQKMLTSHKKFEEESQELKKVNRELILQNKRLSEKVNNLIESQKREKEQHTETSDRKNCPKIQRNPAHEERPEIIHLDEADDITSLKMSVLSNTTARVNKLGEQFKKMQAELRDKNLSTSHRPHLQSHGSRGATPLYGSVEPDNHQTNSANSAPPSASRQEKTNLSAVKQGPEIIYVHDSSGNQIAPHRIHHSKVCHKSLRYNIKEAIRNVPTCDNPDQVTDVIFNVGLNDVRLGSNSDDIRNETFQMQHMYYKKYPNARHHLCAIPPTSQIHIDVNRSLASLAQATGANFISVKNLSDPSTKRALPRLTDPENQCYNAEGIKMLAKQIKKSIYSSANPVGQSESHQ